jgi:hypothetical protein
MTYHNESHESREFSALGIGLILYSILFVSVLSYGWYYIFSGSFDSIVSGLLSMVLALLAWTLAKIVGGNEKGIPGNKALFIALLILSAIGVFNTLMIKLEGKAVFTEVIDDATRQYDALPVLAKNGRQNKEVEALRARVEGLKVQLEQEIINPRNCGDGPEANKILSEIRTVLPGFIRYSGNARDCDNNREIVNMYFTQMDKLMYGTDVFVRANVQQLEEFERRVNAEVPMELAKLDQLRKEVNEGAGLGVVRPRLEDSASAYQALALALKNTVPSVESDRAFKAQLNIDSARNLGEWGHLLPLFLSRIDKAQTWVYLSIALFLDWLLVHMFARIAAHRRQMPTRRRPMPEAARVETPW